MTVSQSDNPYLPPEQHQAAGEGAINLQPGEFRVEGNMLLVAGNVELPQTCIRTGGDENLRRRELTAWYLSGVGHLAEFGLAIVLLAIVYGLWVVSFMASQRLGVSFEFTLILPALCLPLHPRLKNAMRKWTSLPVTVTCFENETVFEKRQRRTRAIWMGILILSIALTVVLFQSLQTMIGIPLVIVGYAIRADTDDVRAVKYENDIYYLHGIPLHYLEPPAFR